MAISIRCACGFTGTVPDAFAGKKGRCPRCSAVLPIPLHPDGAPAAVIPVKGAPRPPSRRVADGRRKEDRPVHHVPTRLVLIAAAILAVFVAAGGYALFRAGQSHPKSPDAPPPVVAPPNVDPANVDPNPTPPPGDSPTSPVPDAPKPDSADLETLGLRAGVFYTCERVVDGDTIVVADRKVRLVGANAPESKDPQRGPEFFGKEASTYTTRTLEGKKVRLEFAEKPRDAFGRLLAYVYTEDGKLFNAQLISEGYAYSLRKYKHPKMDEFNALEAEAQARKVNLWDEEAREHYRGVKKPGAVPVPDDADWVGNKDSRIVHRRGCLALPVASKQVYFKTLEEAETAGYRPHDCVNRAEKK